MNKKSTLLGGVLLGMGVFFSASAAWAISNTEIRSLLTSGQYEEALNSTGSELQLRPLDMELRLLQGVALARTGSMKQAIAVFKALVVENPGDPQLMNNLAAIYAGQGDFRAAEDMLSRAVLLSPDYSVARANLGDLYANMARTQYTAALASTPNDPILMNKLNTLNVLFGMEPALQGQVQPKRVKTQAVSAPRVSFAVLEAAPAVAKILDTCFMTGPFLDQSKLEKVRHWLEGQSATVFEQSRETERTVTTVYLPLADAQGIAAEEVERLHGLGLTDVRVIKPGVMEGDISLGVFRNTDSVVRRINELSDMGIDALTRVETFIRTRPWLQVQPQAGSPVDVIALLKEFDRYDAVGLDIESGCATQTSQQ